MAVIRSLLSFALAVIVILYLNVTPTLCLPRPMIPYRDHITTFHAPNTDMVPRCSSEIPTSFSNMSPEPTGNDPATILNRQEGTAQKEGEKKLEHLNIHVNALSTKMDFPNPISAVLASFSRSFLRNSNEALSGKFAQSPHAGLSSTEICERDVQGSHSSNQPQPKARRLVKRISNAAIDKFSIGMIFGCVGIAAVSTYVVSRLRKDGTIFPTETLRRLAAKGSHNTSVPLHPLSFRSSNANEGLQGARDSPVAHTTITRPSSPEGSLTQDEIMSLSSHEHLRPPLPTITLSPVPGWWSPSPRQRRRNVVNDEKEDR